MLYVIAYYFQHNSLNPKFHLDHCDYLDENIIKVDFNCIELVIRTTIKNHLDTFCTINIIEPGFHNENLSLVYKDLIVAHCNKHFAFLEKCAIIIESSDKLKLINDVFITFEKEFNCS